MNPQEHLLIYQLKSAWKLFVIILNLSFQKIFFLHVNSLICREVGNLWRMIIVSSRTQWVFLQISSNSHLCPEWIFISFLNFVKIKTKFKLRKIENKKKQDIVGSRTLYKDCTVYAKEKYHFNFLACFFCQKSLLLFFFLFLKRDQNV